MRVLMPSSEWPDPANPNAVPFLVRQVEMLRAAGIEVEVFPFRGGARPGNYLRAWKSFRARLRSFRPELVHAQFGQSGLLALPKRCPLVVTFRGDDLLGIVGENGRYTRSGRALQAASRFVSRRADRCIVVSAHMRAFLPRGVEAVVAPSGMDLTAVTPVPRAEARRALGVESDGPIVLFAGNPAEKRKRFGLAQEVVSLLPEALGATMYPAWNLKHETVIQWMSAADALLFVSMHEGSPNVVKEALACNLPVVSVPVGDVPERLKGVRNCFLSPNDEAATLAESLASVLMRGERSDGRDHVQDLDENRITQIVLDEYAEARGKAQAPRRPLPESARSG